MNMLEVTVYDGMYTVIQDESGRLYALRYGEKWRDLVGDGLILSLAQEIEELRKELDEKKSELAELWSKTETIINDRIKSLIQENERLCKENERLKHFCDEVSDICKHPTISSNERMTQIRKAGRELLPNYPQILIEK